MSTFLIANSLVDGFLGSNAVGRGIVIIQLCLSVGMVASSGSTSAPSNLHSPLLTFSLYSTS